MATEINSDSYRADRLIASRKNIATVGKPPHSVKAGTTMAILGFRIA
jgi:hypothetical protein